MDSERTHDVPPTPTILVSTWDTAPPRPPGKPPPTPQYYYQGLNDECATHIHVGVPSEVSGDYYSHRLDLREREGHDPRPLYDGDDEDHMNQNHDSPPVAGLYSPDTSYLTGTGGSPVLQDNPGLAWAPHSVDGVDANVSAAFNLPGDQQLNITNVSTETAITSFSTDSWPNAVPEPAAHSQEFGSPSSDTVEHQAYWSNLVRMQGLTLNTDLSSVPSLSSSVSSPPVSQQQAFRDNNGFLSPRPTLGHHRTQSDSYGHSEPSIMADFAASRGRHVRNASLPTRRRSSPYPLPDLSDHGHLSSSAVEFSSGAHSGADEGQSPTEEAIARRVVANKNVQKANHARRKHPARFACDICGDTFTAKWSLQRHTTSHSGERNYPCSADDCEETFYNIDDCKRHEVSQHNIRRGKGKGRQA